MARVAAEPLKALETEEQAHRLLLALRKDMPHSLHVMNNLECLLEWKRTGLLEKDFHPVLRYAMYRYAGDGDSSDGDATMVTITKVEPYMAVVCIHSTDATGAALQRVLADSALLPWSDDILFESVHERLLPALQEAISARGDRSQQLFRTDKMILHKEEALQLDVSCPPGYVLLPLEVKHSAAVERTWSGRIRTGARELINSILIRNRGFSWGVFLEDQTEDYPAAHILSEGGYLRMLATSDMHRRKGLGGLVTRKCARILAERGKDLHANIEYPNPGSEAIFRKLGFKKICECTYVAYHAPRTYVEEDPGKSVFFSS